MAITGHFSSKKARNSDILYTPDSNLCILVQKATAWKSTLPFASNVTVALILLVITNNSYLIDPTLLTEWPKYRLCQFPVIEHDNVQFDSIV